MTRTCHIYAAAILASLLIILGGCSKGEVGTTIGFEVLTPEVSVSADPMTKGEITASNLTDVQTYVYVKGTRNGNSLFGTTSVARLWYNGTTGRWAPSITELWTDQDTYTFYGYAFRQPNGTSLLVSNQGYQISVRQPDTYTPGVFADYLLSDQLIYPPSSVHRLVPLQLRHALAKVEIYVTRAIGMNDVTISAASVTFEGIRNTSTLTYSSDHWTSIPGETKVNYTHQTTTNGDIKAENAPDIEPFMSFIAVPAHRTALTNSQITVSYTAVSPGSTPQTYTRSFNLYGLGNNWDSGHKITYRFLIDNGIHLSGSITDWSEEDVIEGTIIP